MATREIDERLISACATGDSDLVRSLIKEHGANVNAKDDNDDKVAALHIACRNSSVEVVQALLDAGARVNAKDAESNTPLHEACSKGQLEIAELLMGNKALVNAKNSDEMTPLHMCCVYGNFECAKSLIRKGAKLEAENIDGMTPLHMACLDEDPKKSNPQATAGKISIIGELLLAGVNIEHTEYNELTPLLLACSAGKPEIVSHLINSGANIFAESHDKSTALHFASRGGSLDVIRVLVENNLAIDAKNSDRFTPLHTACKEGGSVACAKLLIDLGANIQLKNMYGQTPTDLDESGEVARYIKSIEMGENITRALSGNGNDVQPSRTSSGFGPSL